jgi:hypothetical protein
LYCHLLYRPLYRLLYRLHLSRLAQHCHMHQACQQQQQQQKRQNLPQTPGKEVLLLAQVLLRMMRGLRSLKCHHHHLLLLLLAGAELPEMCPFLE